MKLIKLIVSVQYKQVPKGLDYRSKLIDLFIDKKSQKPPSFTEVFRTRVKDKKMFFIVSANKAGVEINQPSNEEAAVNECFSFFKKVNNLTQWESVDRIGVRSMWVEPWDLELNKLVDIYKTKIYKDTSLLKNADDVGAFLTLSDDLRKINFQTGPMGKKQLVNAFLPPAPFDETNLPEVFSFVDYDYYISGNTEYSNLTMEKFIKHAVEMGKTKSNETIKILKGGV